MEYNNATKRLEGYEEGDERNHQTNDTGDLKKTGPSINGTMLKEDFWALGQKTDK